MDVSITPVTGPRLSDVVTLLEACGLPEAGLREHATAVLGAMTGGGTLIGCAALEVYGDVALLRSVAVHPRHRGTGLGGRLTDRAVDAAREHGVAQLYLLTETAESFFPRFGFAPVDRSDVPPSIRTTVEFSSACPASATVMMLRLTGAAAG